MALAERVILQAQVLVLGGYPGIADVHSLKIVLLGFHHPRNSTPDLLPDLSMNYRDTRPQDNNVEREKAIKNEFTSKASNILENEKMFFLACFGIQEVFRRAVLKNSHLPSRKRSFVRIRI